MMIPHTPYVNMPVRVVPEPGKDVQRIFLGVLHSRRPHMVRLSLFEVMGEYLQRTWPPDPHLCTKAQLLPHQVFSIGESWPAFHFAIPNPTTTWVTDFETALSKHLKYRVEIHMLGGIHA